MMQANVMVDETTQPTYQCPGEPYRIGRAMHLGRLASFHPACRTCPHRDDVASLALRTAEQLADVHRQRAPRRLFDDEGACGVFLNEIGPREAHRIGQALASWLRNTPDQSAGPTTGEIVLGGDGRPAAGELVAALAAGVRSACTGVVDVGCVTSAALAHAVELLGAAGGVLVGNPASRPQTVGLKFWARGGRPLSAGAGLEDIRESFHAPFDRPARRDGPRRRWSVQQEYLSGLEDYYHALRPLRVVLDTGCGPLWKYLDVLSRTVACRMIPARRRETSAAFFPTASGDPPGSNTAAPTSLGAQVRDEQAHFGIWIDGDGEAAAVVDERGSIVGPTRLLPLIAGQVLAEHPASPVVVDEPLAAGLAGPIQRLGSQVVRGGPTRASMAVAMRQSGASVGAGPGGRYWFGEGIPTPDALRLLTLLLTLLSQSDRPLSRLLDETAAGG